MRKVYLFAFLLLVTLSGSALAQNVLVSGALVGNGSYPTLGAAFTAINGGAQTGAIIIVSITGNTTEPVTATLNQGSWTYLYVSPQGGATRTISGAIVGPLVEFNSADRVAVDGVNSGGNALVIENTSVGNASTVHFINDARAVGFQNLTLLGASTSSVMGTVFIDLGTGTGGGNDSLAFSNVSIGNSGANFPVNGVFSAGTVTAGQENSNVQFQNCSIFNYFSATVSSRGIFASTGNTDWSIAGSRFYQTASRAYTTANTHGAIKIGVGDNHLVSGNTIGFASAAGAGTYTMTSTVATRFIGIEVSAGITTASSIQGNTVTAISLTTSSGATTTYGILCGISVTTGNINIGNLTPNVIGAAAGVDQLVATPSTAGGSIVGIHTSSTGTVLIQSNIIGGFTSVASTATNGGGLMGISVSGVATSLTITSNTIGNATPDNMRSGTLGVTTGSSIASGINMTALPVAVTVSNNTIRNISSFGTGTGGYIRGIWTLASTTNTGVPTITGNNISNLTTTNGNASYSSALIGTAGIILAAGNNGVVNGNTITNVRNNNTATTGLVVAAMSHGSSTNGTFSNNTIYGIGNASTSVTVTAPGVAAGLVVRSGTTGLTVFNNMISLGNGETSNTCFVGILGNHGSTPDPLMKIYHNTINIEGVAASGAQPSFGIARTDFTISARTAAYDVRNNIITNTRTGGTGQHFAIANNYGATATATGWGLNASNNNVLNANPSTVGFWTTTLPFVGWKAAANSDVASFSGVVVTYVNNASNLHLNFGTTANALESTGQTIAAVTTDIDGQTRPGPTGSVNGGALAPDLGADEFDGVIGDFSAPAITFTPLTFTCLTGDRTIVATITDNAGTPTTGILQPRIYFRKNLGAWFSTQGTLTTGTGINGTWTFTIPVATLGGVVIGDNVQYYVIAQDITNPIPNIGSVPSVGLVATDVNTITTPPTTPNTYAISGTLGGTYTVGATGAYPTLTAGVNAYNTSCLSGPMTLSLVDALYPTETYPITVTNNPDASAVNTLTIKPATGISPSFSGSSATAMLNLSGADYVTVDGSNGSIANAVCPRATATRDLTITNTNVSLSSFVVAITTTAGTDAATNNRLLNCNLVGNSNTTTQGCVTISGPILGLGTGANANNNNQVINNAMQKSQFGIVAISTGAPKSINNQYSLNSLDVSGANALGRLGIVILGEDAPIIHANSIANMIFTGSNDVIGISVGFGNVTNSATVGLEVTNASIMYNRIDNLVESNTYSAVGIAVASTATGTTTIANNFIGNIFANGTGGDFAAGIFSGGGVGQLNIYHNTITITGTTLTGGSQPNMAIGLNGTTPSVDIRNNILTCTGDNGFAGNTGIGLGYSSTLGNYLNLVSDNNDIYVAGTGAVIGRTGGLAAGTVRTTLLDWQTETGRDAASVSVLPVFVSASDLHMVNTNFGLSNLGTLIVSQPTDIDCGTRSATTPDMGADEWLPACSTAVAGALLPGDLSSCLADSITLSCVTYSTGIGSTYTWESSPFGLNTWGAAGGSNPDNFSTGIVNVPTEYRLVVGCATNSSSVFSDTLSFYVGDSTDPVAVCRNITVTLGTNGTVVVPSDTLDNGSTDNCTSNASLGFTLGQSTFTCAQVGANLAILFVQDSLANTDSCSAIITVLPTALSATISSPVLANGENVSCFGGNDGTAQVVGSGGCPTNSYLWSNGQTTATAVGLIAGTYTVTVTDGSGQTTTQSITLTQPSAALGSTVTTTDESCVPGNDGTVDLTPAGGSPGYTYVWSNSATTEDLSGLGAGTITVTITDIAGCTSTASATVVVSPPPATPVITQNGINLETSATGVTYQWFLNGSPIPGATGASTPISSSGGSYTVTITDGNGCTATSVAFIVVGVSAGNFDNALQVWPNPARGTAYLSLLGSDVTPCTLVITDLRGRILFAQNHLDLSGKFEIDLHQFAAGTYLVETMQNDVRRTVRLVVQ